MKKILILLIAGLMILGIGFSADRVSVGAKNFTEEYVMGALASALLEDAGFRVSEDFGMSTFAVRTALKTGQIDMYPDYTGTAWTAFFKKEEVVRDPVELYERVKKIDLEENNIVWLDRLPFNNTYALGITNEMAKKYNLRTLEDLAEFINTTDENIIFGVEYEFYDRPDGFFAMADAYGMTVNKKNVKTMDIGMTYEAIARDSIQVAMVFSTDGKLDKYNLTVLEDNQNFFPIYNPAITIRKEVYDKYPEIEEILKPLSQYLNANIIRRMNYLVDAAGMEPDEVARDFLNGLGLLKK
jgi:osmoprotectant transport system substrate-binding protein